MARPRKTIIEMTPSMINTIVNESLEPEKDIKLGDMTPSYIEWFYENKSQEDFISKYFGRRYRKDLHKYFKNNK